MNTSIFSRTPQKTQETKRIPSPEMYTANPPNPQNQDQAWAPPLVDHLAKVEEKTFSFEFEK